MGDAIVIVRQRGKRRACLVPAPLGIVGSLAAAEERRPDIEALVEDVLEGETLTG